MKSRRFVSNCIQSPQPTGLQDIELGWISQRHIRFDSGRVEVCRLGRAGKLRHWIVGTFARPAHASMRALAMGMARPGDRPGPSPPRWFVIGGPGEAGTILAMRALREQTAVSSSRSLYIRRYRGSAGVRGP